MRAYTLAISLFLLAGASSEGSELGWADLIDQSAQTFEDPYADLSYDHLEAVATIARSRAQLASGTLSEEERAAIAGGLKAAEAALIAAGIDADWLIAQRWVVADRRKRAANAGNPAVDGAEVTLAGYAVPAPDAEDGTPVAYLVPERGMCAHMPPPPPNQMIRLSMPADWVPRMMHEPIQVTGLLRIDPTEDQVMVIDGFVPMSATFALRVQNVEKLVRPQADGSQEDSAANEWTARILERMRAAESIETNEN